MAGLTAANRAVLAHVRERARHEQPRHRERIQRVLAGADVDALLAAVRSVGCVTLNFNPDARLADGRSVADALLAEGV
jgi:hypothetical protein